MFELIDSHCHLDFAVFDKSRVQILERALAHNVTRFVVPSVTASRFDTVLSMRDVSSRIAIAFGLHPCFMSAHQTSDLDLLRVYCQQYSPCAVGEIGLDFYLPDADREQQILLLTQQLAVAQACGLPVILHVRKAHSVLLEILKKMRFTQGGIVHAFSGSMEQAKEYLALGFKLGFGGTLTYEGSKRIRKLAAELPLSAIVLETDSPDMPLAGFQGQANAPERVADVLQVLAQLRTEPLEVLAKATTDNVKQRLVLS